MDSQGPKATSFILKFKEPTMAEEEDFEYSEDDDLVDNEEDDDFNVFGLSRIVRKGEGVKKKKLVDSTTRSGKKQGNVSTGGSGGMVLLSCQVDKCGADLKEAKRYYSRHKVCEFHAKSPFVVVDGIQQRFCQQCSRFEELGEFDEMRRSCRRRLAGHNQRRRKFSSETQGDDGLTQTCQVSIHVGDGNTTEIFPKKHIQFH